MLIKYNLDDCKCLGIKENEIKEVKGWLFNFYEGLNIRNNSFYYCRYNGK